ncbi:XAP5 CIRCADIAN TIMEKEEPER [Chlorella sorokiniana]|uniref:XAP5 CIRCADIAN TIMEKEEPER n=1 Tax=Chlorella sorokiniana TaxID=3076 RepID=A0A2P6TC03_CHLSO|nr:XAP5 CIRCADIAN TIMEKEEPER [Chlorella sorokiniana]|eukprot:PRW18417.1 XAP5 CIRCADIAN TIMEKEEPER [Chlorella sorokiniana]
MSGYGMGGYVGSSKDKKRIEQQLKEREEQHKKFEEAKKAAAAGAGLRQFGAASSEAIEAAFKNETIGLVTREQFVEKRQTIEERLKEEEKRRRHEAEEEALREKERQRAKKAKTEQKHKLSFDDGFGDEEEEEEEEAAEAAKPSTSGRNGSSGNGGGGSDREDGEGASRPRYSRLGKDPTVRTDFLPDKDRQREEDELREKLKEEYALRQAAIKAEPLEIIYSYYNGTGHRRAITVRKGDTVGQFLKAVVEQLMPQFREMRTASAGNLMYVKEDIILPHTISFYDLIVNKAMGKSGPLFQFDLHEHAAAAFDPRVKSQDSHAGKVVDRHWYSKNKHIYPASRWAPFDEAKQYVKEGDKPH